MKEREM